LGEAKRNRLDYVMFSQEVIESVTVVHQKFVCQITSRARLNSRDLRKRFVKLFKLLLLTEYYG